jgi:hypothetical protein
LHQLPTLRMQLTSDDRVLDGVGSNLLQPAEGVLVP